MQLPFRARTSASGPSSEDLKTATDWSPQEGGSRAVTSSPPAGGLLGGVPIAPPSPTLPGLRAYTAPHPPARSQGRRTPTALSVLDAEGGRRSGCHRAEGAAAAPSCPRSPGAAGRLGFPLQSGAKRSQAGPLAQAAPVGWLVLIPLVCPRPRSGWQGTRLDGQGQRSSAPTWAPGRLHAAWAAEMQGQHLSAEDALASCPLPEPPWGTWQEPAPALPPASAATPRRSAGHTPRATAALPEAPCDSAASMPGHAARLGLGEGRSQELLNQRPPCVPACPCPPPPRARMLGRWGAPLRELSGSRASLRGWRWKASPEHLRSPPGLKGQGFRMGGAGGWR